MSAALHNAALPAFNKNNGLDEAVPHSAALSLYNPSHTCTRAHAHTRTEAPYMGKCGTVRHCGTVSALSDLAHRVARLCPDHRNPERFHEDKSEIAAELRRLARLMGMAPL